MVAVERFPVFLVVVPCLSVKKRPARKRRGKPEVSFWPGPLPLF